MNEDERTALVGKIAREIWFNHSDWGSGHHRVITWDEALQAPEHSELKLRKEQTLWQAERALAAYEQHMAERGMVSVPREPTAEMVEKGVWSRSETGTYEPETLVTTIYCAMVAAANEKPPAD